MSPRAKGLYSSWKVYLPDNTGWFVGLDIGPSALGLKREEGWPVNYEDKEFDGDALVAPLPILFWEKE